MKGRAAAAFCVAGVIACSEGSGPPAATQRALGGDIVARVGSEEVGVDTLRRVASAQAVPPREALDLALFDAVLAAEAKTALPEAERHNAADRVHARLLIEELARAARAEGPPTDAEVEAKTTKYWIRVARPKSVVAAHALVVVPGGSDESEWKKAERIATKIAEAVRKPSEPLKAAKATYDFDNARIADPAGGLGGFFEAAKTVDAEGMTLRIESLPPLAADNLTVMKVKEERVAFDPAFTAAAVQLEPGAISSPVRSAFGVHIIVGVVAIPAEELTLERRRERFADEIYSDRTRKLTDNLLEELRRRHEVEVERSADTSLSEVKVAP